MGQTRITPPERSIIPSHVSLVGCVTANPIHLGITPQKNIPIQLCFTPPTRPCVTLKH